MNIVRFLIVLLVFAGFPNTSQCQQDQNPTVENSQSLESESSTKLNRLEKLRKSLFKRQLRKEARRSDRSTASAIREVLRDSDLFEITYEAAMLQYHKGELEPPDDFLVGSDGQIINAIKDFIQSLIDNREGLIELIQGLIDVFKQTEVSLMEGPDTKKLFGPPLPCGMGN